MNTIYFEVVSAFGVTLDMVTELDSAKSAFNNAGIGAKIYRLDKASGVKVLIQTKKV